MNDLSGKPDPETLAPGLQQVDFAAGKLPNAFQKKFGVFLDGKDKMKNLGELTVGSFLTSQAIVVDDTEKLTHAIRTMDDERLTVLPVVGSQGEVVGILSATDLIQITHEIQADVSALCYANDSTQEYLLKMLIEQGDSTLVRDVMTAPVDTVTENTNMVVAARMLTERKVHHLPVVNDQGKPIGILSTSDFVKAFAEYGASLTG